MNYSKLFMFITIAAFILTLFIIGKVMCLKTTWLGVYNPEGNLQLETKNVYSSTFFTKGKCEAWIKKQMKIETEGLYVCGKNCHFRTIGLLDCDKLYEY